MRTSGELLREYAAKDSEAAFHEIVNRYINLVYSVALRQVWGDAHLAKDVAQTVFTDLARKARRLPLDVMLGGWLHRHTRFVAMGLMRSESRRRTREREAADMNTLHPSSDQTWTQMEPLLDEAIDQLNKADREAVVLRFFEGRDFRAIGAALGVTDDAAQKRVARALEKLHQLLTRRGATVSPIALAAVLAGPAIMQAPASLAASVSAAAISSAAAGGGAVTLLKYLGAAKVKAATATVAAVAVVTPMGWQYTTNKKMQSENAALRQQVVMLTERSSASSASATTPSTNPEPQIVTQTELLRLRGEVARLLRENRELSQQAATGRVLTPEQVALALKGSGVLPRRVVPPAGPLSRDPAQYRIQLRYSGLTTVLQKLESDGGYVDVLEGPFDKIGWGEKHLFLNCQARVDEIAGGNVIVDLDTGQIVRESSGGNVIDEKPLGDEAKAAKWATRFQHGEFPNEENWRVLFK